MSTFEDYYQSLNHSSLGAKIHSCKVQPLPFYTKPSSSNQPLALRLRMWLRRLLQGRRTRPAPQAAEVLLSEGVEVDVGAAVERCPFGLVFEETHCFDVLDIP